MSAHHVKQRKAGTVRIITPAVRYREGHIWHLDTAAVYRTGLRFGPGDELGALLAHGIVTALGGITRRARAAVPSPFEAAATEISLDGPHTPGRGGEGMMLAAGPGGTRILPAPGLPGTCPGCGAPMTAKCGAIVVRHGAHRAGLRRDRGPSATRPGITPGRPRAAGSP